MKEILAFGRAEVERFEILRRFDKFPELFIDLNILILDSLLSPCSKLKFDQFQKLIFIH